MSNPNNNNAASAEQTDILAILKAAGFSLEDAKAQLRTVSKQAADERAEMLESRKESNKEALIEIACDVRQSLEDAFADILPGSHLSFTVRKDAKSGEVIATANDGHATKVISSIHVDASGTVCFGAEGAEQAKNVRARRKSA